MKTETTIETSSQLFRIVEDKLPFEPIETVNQTKGKYMSIEYMTDSDDGIFPRVLDWTKFCNKIDKLGVSSFLNWRQKNKLKINNGYCAIVRENEYTDKATLIFNEPIEVIVEYLNDEPIIIKVSKIEGEFTYEWGFLKNGRQDKIANTIEIYFDCQKYLK